MKQGLTDKSVIHRQFYIMVPENLNLRFDILTLMQRGLINGLCQNLDGPSSSGHSLTYLRDFQKRRIFFLKNYPPALQKPFFKIQRVPPMDVEKKNSSNQYPSVIPFWNRETKCPLDFQKWFLQCKGVIFQKKNSMFLEVSQICQRMA